MGRRASSMIRGLLVSVITVGCGSDEARSPADAGTTPDVLSSFTTSSPEPIGAEEFLPPCGGSIDGIDGGTSTEFADADNGVGAVRLSATASDTAAARDYVEQWRTDPFDCGTEESEATQLDGTPFGDRAVGWLVALGATGEQRLAVGHDGAEVVVVALTVEDTAGSVADLDAVVSALLQVP